MSKDISQLANAGVRGLQPYAPGKPMSELERELGISDIVKLASNENPLGCSVKVRELLATVNEEISLYPDGNGFALKQALIDHLNRGGYQLTEKNILLGNGSNDVLELIARAFLNESSEAVYSQHAFAVYPLAVQAVGAKAKVAPARDWGHDLDAMANLLSDKTRVVFVANPNNPTGTWLKRQDIENFLSCVPESCVVVLDEAYFEYVQEEEYPDGLDYLDKYSNLIVTRTFSKAYGLAGLRVGYGVASEAMVDILNRIRQPFNVNALAQASAVKALEDQAFIDASVKCNTEGLAFLEAELESLGLAWIESVANFICIDFGYEEKAQAAYDFLLRNGMIVRPVGVYQMPQFLRATVGDAEQNRKLVQLLAAFLDQA